ncbi:ThuA domain-containing protein [Microbacterium sp. MPKO10]|uniref:ThuA domain-containing protein n=1 Tax=Microbacterium sp. MPKO10 TaxID=2989818 RepID=UPI0022363D2D|nr:ThuA domain-containing protein [Microbacterium sp. MPKO10]MCW4459808.1 ThuA domain-containing protein [Microbacterium sp. MPKO10]
MSTQTAPLRITVWGENRHEKTDQIVQELYPEGMHTTIAEGIEEHLETNAVVRTVTFDDDEHGLTDDVLAETDVLTWWGHRAHKEVSDDVVDRVQQHVLSGMGLLVLHSGHFSKIFKRLMGTTCSLRWRNEDDRELVWTVDPAHPIVRGVSNPIDIPQQEMYGEFFDIPTPDETVFISSYSGGEVFRSGLTFKRGRGRIFYFSPGDQAYPVYHHPDVRRVLANACEWAANSGERALPALQRTLPV